jgi:hypothetical protein
LVDIGAAAFHVIVGAEPPPVPGDPPPPDPPPPLFEPPVLEPEVELDAEDAPAPFESPLEQATRARAGLAAKARASVSVDGRSRRVDMLPPVASNVPTVSIEFLGALYRARAFRDVVFLRIGA